MKKSVLFHKQNLLLSKYLTKSMAKISIGLEQKNCYLATHLLGHFSQCFHVTRQLVNKLS